MSNLRIRTKKLTIFRILFSTLAFLPNLPGDEETTSRHVKLLKMVFGLYNVVAVVVLLNMLIGMMAKSYDGVEEKAQQTWAFHRTKNWMMYVKGQVVTPPPMNLKHAEN